MEYEFKISDLKGIFRRRRKLLIGSFGLIFLTGLIVAFALPPIYQSQVMILIENQEIPKEFVQSTTASFINERINILERQILSPKKLNEIIRAHDLYPDLQSKSERISQMQENIVIENVTVNTQTGAKGGFATIAFTLSFAHKNPRKAAEVADILSKLFVEEDRLTRSSRASATTNFLSKELEGLRRLVKENEEKISRFKAANIDQLPGSTGIFQQTVLRLEQDIERIDSRIRTLNEKNVYLKSQIANIDPLIPIQTEKGKVAANPANRLKFLRLQLIQLQSTLSDRHPDIIRLKNEIAELEAQVGDKDTSLEKINRLKILEKEIAEAKSKYGDAHPDVVRLKREADLLNQQVGQQKTVAGSKEIPEELSDNPGYMNIRAQIIVTEAEIESLKADRGKAIQRLVDYQRRLEMAPFVEEQFNALTLDYQNAKRKFDEVSRDLHTARISQEMDLSDHGARFRINSPAFIPKKPFEPNRWRILFFGFLLAIGCAVVLAAVAEGLDSSIKAPDELESVLGVPVLTTISMYDSPVHKRKLRMRRLALVSSIIVFIVVGSMVVDRFVVPLSDVWNTVEDRLVDMGLPIDEPASKS